MPLFDANQSVQRQYFTNPIRSTQYLTFPTLDQCQLDNAGGDGELHKVKTVTGHHRVALSKDCFIVQRQFHIEGNFLILVSKTFKNCAALSFQISKSGKVSIPKVRLSSNQSCVVALSDIDGRASISGKVECIGCNHGDKPSSSLATRPVDTLFALFVNSVSHFVIEHCQVEAPLRHVTT